MFGLLRVVQRQDHALVDGGEHVRDEPQLAQGKIDVAEHRLAQIEGYERHLRVHGHGIGKTGLAVVEDGKLAALHIDLQEVELADLGDAVERAGLDLDLLTTRPKCMKFGNRLSTRGLGM